MSAAIRRGILLFISFATMAVFGFIENLKGPIIPRIRETFAVPYGSIGLMLFLSSLGYLCTVILGGIASERFGKKAILAAGYLLVFASAAGMSLAAGFVPVAVFMFLLNAGFGFFEIGLNSLAARLFTRNTAFMMNLLHLFYGAGAAGGPRFAGLLLLSGLEWQGVYIVSLILPAAVFLPLVFTRFPREGNGEPPAEGSSSDTPAYRGGIRSLLLDPVALPFGAVLGFGLILEMGIANWLVAFLQGARGMNAGDSSLYLSLFFLFFTLGRLAGGWAAERIGYDRILLLFSGICLLLFAGGMLVPAAPILFSLMGFFVAISFPTVMAMIARIRPRNTGAIMGFAITTAGIINMSANWLIGKVADVSLPAGFSFVGISAAGMILFLLLLRRRLVPTAA